MTFFSISHAFFLPFLNVLSLLLFILPLQMVTDNDPDIIALHCQEIGGKDFGVTMPMVWQFVK